MQDNWNKYAYGWEGLDYSQVTKTLLGMLPIGERDLYMKVVRENDVNDTHSIPFLLLEYYKLLQR